MSDPGVTAPLHLPGDFPPTRGRRALMLVLALFVGLAGGFAGSQLLTTEDETLPDADFVFYEASDVAFPIEGARFTDSTFDPSKNECDKELLKRLLRENDVKFEAWLDLQEITEGDFGSFIDRLTSDVLTKATPVTNFGCFADGECPFSIQSVLGPGTPVWRDPQQGDRIVAKCACSNPIREPRCPPNCEELPTPTPTPSPTPTFTPTSPPTPTPTVTFSPTPPPTRSPTPPPTPSATLLPTFSPQPPN